MAEKIYVGCIDQEVDLDRVIFSWMQVNGDFTGFDFYVWLRYKSGIAVEDIRKIELRLMEGKFELEKKIEAFCKAFTSEDCEKMFDKNDYTELMEFDN